MDKWARVALEEGWVVEWVAGAIFPCEMVYFLAICENNGVVSIIESGRQDGYSTEILGRYAREKVGWVHSIDMERDPEQAFRCRKRLAGNPHLSLIRGNSVSLIGPLLQADPHTPTAVLVDGPKGYPAISLLLAAGGMPGVRVLSLHNLHEELESTVEQRRLWIARGPGPHFYEDVQGGIGEHWQQLRAAEQALGEKVGVARSLNQSSLGVLQTSVISRKKLVLTVSPKFGMRQPARLYGQWRLFGKF